MKSLRKRTGDIPDGYVGWRAERSVSMHINTTYDMIKYQGKSKSISVSSYKKIHSRADILWSMFSKKANNSYETAVSMIMFYLTSHSPDTFAKPATKVFINPRELVADSFLAAYDGYKTRTYHREETFKGDLSAVINLLGNESARDDRKKIMMYLLRDDPVSAMIILYKNIIRHGLDNEKCDFLFDTLVVLDKLSGASAKIKNSSEYSSGLIGSLAGRINKMSSIYDPDMQKYKKYILDFCKTETYNTSQEKIHSTI